MTPDGRWRLPTRALTQTVVAPDGPPVSVRVAGATGSPAVRDDPQPAITLHEDDATWHPRPDLLGSGPFDHGFVVETESDGTTFVRFGDGAHGRKPDDPTTLTTLYRTGHGPAGNVGAEAIRHVTSRLDGIRSVRNPLPAAGGRAREAIEPARRRIPSDFRRQERAVTVDDHAMITRRHPEVQDAVARLAWTGSWHTVFVTVDRLGGHDVDAAFEAQLRAHFERHRLAGSDVEFENARSVPLDLVLAVCVHPDHERAHVLAALQEVFTCGVRRDGTRGFFHPDRWRMGQSVHLSPILAAAADVPGVAWVDAMERPESPSRFRRIGEPYRGRDRDGVIALHPTEVVRVENDRDRPMRGHIRFHAEGGL